MSGQCWRGANMRKGQYEPPHSADSLSFSPMPLPSVSNLWGLCADHVFVCVWVCVRTPACPHLLCVFNILCACAWMCVCWRLVTLEPVVLSSDPDPCHLSTWITHTHTHTLTLAVTHSRSWNPILVVNDPQLASTARFCFFWAMWLTWRSYSLL